MHLWGDFRQQEQRSCQRTKGMRRQERWEGVWLLPPSACPSFSLLHAQPPADLHHQESQRGHAFISLLNGGLLSVIRCGDEAVLGLPLWSPSSMAGEGPLGERGRQGAWGFAYEIKEWRSRSFRFYLSVLSSAEVSAFPVLYSACGVTHLQAQITLLKYS